MTMTVEDMVIDSDRVWPAPWCRAASGRRVPLSVTAFDLCRIEGGTIVEH